MRRAAGPILVGLGVFLFALAVLLPTVVVPRVEKIPYDTYSTSVAKGPGFYLNPETQQFVRNADITVTRVVRGDVKASTDSTMVLDQTQTTEGSGLKPPLNVVAERVVVDRHSGKGIGGRGDRPSHRGSYPIKLPFNTQKTTYNYYEISASKAAPVRFTRETTVNGLKVYEFRGSVPETVTDQLAVPGSLVGAPDTPTVFAERTYATERTILVEPRTGSIVSGTSKPKQTFKPAQFGGQPGTQTTIFEADLRPTAISTAKLVKDAKDAKAQLDLLGRTLPLGLGILGLAALAGGVFLIARNRRGPYEVGAPPAPAHAAP